MFSGCISRQGRWRKSQTADAVYAGQRCKKNPLKARKVHRSGPRKYHSARGTSKNEKFEERLANNTANPFYKEGEIC
jgi:hypothetical protein